MGIELSPKAQRRSKAKRKRGNHMPKASAVTIRSADGTTRVEPPLIGSVDQVKKR